MNITYNSLSTLFETSVLLDQLSSLKDIQYVVLFPGIFSIEEN